MMYNIDTWIYGLKSANKDGGKHEDYIMKLKRIFGEEIEIEFSNDVGIVEPKKYYLEFNDFCEMVEDLSQFKKLLEEYR